MLLNDVQKRFSINYYSWAKEALQGEMEADFPLLKTIPSCRPVIEYFRQLSDQQQLVAISVFSKRGHAEAASLLGEVTTDEEATLLRSYLVFMNRATVQAGDDYSKQMTRVFDRDKFTRTLDLEVSPILGTLIEKGGRSYRRFARNLGVASVETIMDTGGRIHQLQYEHKLLITEGLVRDHVSILSWLGIIAGPTYWKYLNDDTIGSVTEAFKEICSAFIKAVPALLNNPSKAL
jgi:hypothetical protein